jgi:Ca2+-binding EF-hand superfamily protein
MGSKKRKVTREEKEAMVMAEGGQTKFPFSEFLKTIMDFQLKEHERFLSKFIVLFRNIDVDRNGVLDEQEFRALIKSMRILDRIKFVDNKNDSTNKTEEESIEEFLRILDPYTNQRITFTEVVRFLSSVSPQNLTY